MIHAHHSYHCVMCHRCLQLSLYVPYYNKLCRGKDHFYLTTDYFYTLAPSKLSPVNYSVFNMELGRWQDGRTEGRKTDPRKASLTHSQSPSWKPDFPLTSTPPSAMNCSYCHITYLMFQNDHKAKKDVFSFLFIPLNGITFFSINTWKIR